MLSENYETTKKTSMFGFGHNLVNPIISSLVYAIIIVALGDMNRREKLGIFKTILILQKKISSMSKFMKMGIVALTVLFDWYGILKNNKRFHKQSLKEQHKQIRQWKNSPINLFRNFMGFYHKMALFIYYSSSNVLVEMHSVR